MRLQSDPTIVYGLMGGKGPLGRPLLRTEMDEPNPYNTYQVDGLPPGPIANPGRASLDATAHPMHTSELYFVADGSGSHVFSETLDQHLKNVANLRNVEKQQAAEPAPATVQPTVQPQQPAAPAQAQPAIAQQKAPAPLTSPRTTVVPKKKKQAQKKTDAKSKTATPATGQAAGQVTGQAPRTQ